MTPVQPRTVQQLAGRVAPAPVQPGGLRDSASPRASDFAALLAKATEPPRLTVSAHASQRVGERAIDLSEPVQQRISKALDTLDAKGSRDALLIGSDAAFVVSVPNRTVVTALALDEMKDRAITQIDSAFVL
ncbi:MAG: TIGR02530 family flagellar biosynthesis protein [Rubricoccaceae bacterium]